MDEKSILKQNILQAVDGCEHLFQVTLHGQPLHICSNERDTGAILHFLFGRQSEVRGNRLGSTAAQDQPWRLAILSSSAVFQGFDPCAEISPSGDFADLKCYWRPDFPSAFLFLSPDFTVVRHTAPFKGLTILLGKERLLVYVRPEAEPAFIPHIETVAGYLWRVGLWQTGHVDVHSAMVRHRGCGLVMIGPKRAGKTSLAMHFLARGADLLGSDFGEVSVDPQGRLQAFAVPHICRITPETIADNAVLSGAIDISRRDNFVYSVGPVYSHGKFEFFAPGLDDLFQRPVNIRSMPVDLLIFPKFSRDLDRIEITPIPQDIARSRLIESISHDRPLADWLPLPEVVSRKARERDLLTALKDVPVRACQVAFGQEPSLDWTVLDALANAGPSATQVV